MPATYQNNFELLEHYIPYKIVKLSENKKAYIMFSIFDNIDNHFGKRVLMLINNRLDPNYEGNELYEFISEINLDNLEEWQSNHEDIVIGEDFIINLDEYNIDYMDDVNIKDVENIKYFIHKNDLINFNSFSEDDLKALNQTFFKTIIKYSEKHGNSITPMELLYKHVIDFYANGQYDDATILMNSIFGMTIPIYSTTESCGCKAQSSCSTNNLTTSSINTGTNTVNLDTATCEEKYKAAMYQWLIKMLSDINFYCDWMSISLNDNIEIDKIPNDTLIDALIQLLTEFLQQGYDLSNLTNSETTCCNCGHNIKSYNKLNNLNNGMNNGMNNECPDIYSDNSLSLACENNSIINNYIKVLNWVKNKQIDENKNKIYIYGKQFAEILPLLNF